MWTGSMMRDKKRISHAAYALEQQLQCIGKNLGLDLSKLMNTIPGAGKWNDGPGHYYIVVFLCDTRIQEVPWFFHCGRCWQERME